MQTTLQFPGADAFRAGRRVRAALVMLFALAAPQRVPAPEAIPAYQWLGNPLAGFAWGGAGFAFSPQTNIAVTSLGFGGAALVEEPYGVYLRDSNGSPLAQAVVTTGSPVRNGTHYEPIQRFELSAGEQYFLSAAGVNSDAWSGNVLSTSGSLVNGTFSVAPEITYLGSALGTNSDGTFPFNVGANTLLLVGANFEYATRPVIVLSGVSVVGGQVQVNFTVTGGPASLFILLEAVQPVGGWFTNAAAVLTTNVPGQEYTFTSDLQDPTGFFRVLAP